MADRRDNMDRLRAMRLCVLVGHPRLELTALEAARAAVAGGADMIQLREKSLSDRELHRLAQEVRDLTGDAGRTFIVNDRPDIARLVDADGVHVGRDDLPIAAAREIVGPHKIVGVSTHDIEQARQARAEGADYIGVGPVYPTETKGYSEGVGLAYVRQVASEIDLPFLAIGSIRLDRLDEVMDAGARAVAVCAAVVCAQDPAAAARSFKERLASRWSPP